MRRDIEVQNPAALVLDDEETVQHSKSRTRLGEKVEGDDSLSKDTPNRREIEPKPITDAALISQPRLGGLHHRYTWRQAA